MQVFQSRTIEVESFHVNQTTRLVVTLRGIDSFQRARAERALAAFVDALSIRFENRASASKRQRIA